MKIAPHLRQADFDALLRLFSDDPDEAAQVYEKLRGGLIRFFAFRGCSDPDRLADETFDRVSARTERFDSSLGAGPEHFLYGFARLIALEDRRSSPNELSLDGFEEIIPDGSSPPDEKEEDYFNLLRNCFGQLPEEERNLLVEYFSFEGRARIETRSRMGLRLSCTPSALYTRVSRLREKLRKCVGRGLNGNV
jgi:DNA-directed RNA polymerase specialized sigma24 family protein